MSLEAMSAISRGKKNKEKKKTSKEEKKWMEEKEITDQNSDHPNCTLMNDTTQFVRQKSYFLLVSGCPIFN